eukprot:NODE_113_length_18482_cov_1.630746.p4 type:complete len:469 gc:universal NODE_113_length_18482_cov_1.630746:11002-12408(+)
MAKEYEVLKFQDVPKEIKKQRVRRRILKIFPYFQLISILLAVAGIVSWLVLPAITRHTYVSENALMPGQGEIAFKNFDLFENYYNDLKSNVTLEHAFSLVSQEKLTELYALHNNYMLMRSKSQRGDGSETLLLYSSISSPLACALLMAYHEDLRNRNYLAKDVVILITRDEPSGSFEFVKEWYHSNKNLIWNRPGEIQVALGLLLDSKDFDTFDILYTGHQPRLPNLDIINILTRITQMYGLRMSVHGSMAIGGSSYFDYLRRMVWMVSSLMIGDLDKHSAHSNFGTVGLDAVTIHCKNSNTTKSYYTGDGGQSYKTHNPKHVTLVLDYMTRAFNNLLEKFHQSFYFYILASPTKYVSIADMSIPIGILLIALIFQAIALWYYSDSGYEFQKYIPRHTSESRPVLSILKTVMVPLAITTFLFGVVSIIKQIRVFPDNIVQIFNLDISNTCCVEYADSYHTDLKKRRHF